ncbi:MAG: hypothetical protein KKA79_09355, partial [Nanoarchaeota archaeon]|nr:hypothetical protein [Nanoarchaeota archaeon]
MHNLKNSQSNCQSRDINNKNTQLRMRENMSWDECKRQKIVVKVTPDEERAKELIKTAMLRLEFWDRKIENRFAAFKVEAYYEIIKELMLALLYKKGYNSSNH